MLLAVGGLGCEIEKVAVARTDAGVALHGVLSATASSQVVLLERTRSGAVLLTAPPFDIPDPIVGDSGVAEPGAVVTLTTPDGQTLVAVEDNNVRNNGSGQGNYRFNLDGAALVRGATYRLSARTTKGELLTAETSVPGGVAATVAVQRDFDRARDTVVLEWPAAPGARSYFVRIETPLGPRSFFTDSTRVRLTGTIRNANIESLPHVFIPGFPQAVTVSAVDSNFYDWYRSHSDGLSGIGLAALRRTRLDVQREPQRERGELLVARADETIRGFHRVGLRRDHVVALEAQTHERPEYAESSLDAIDQPNAGQSVAVGAIPVVKVRVDRRDGHRLWEAGDEDVG